MLVLTRKIHERIVVDGPCVIELVNVDGYGRARIGIVAGPDVKVLRSELVVKEEKARVAEERKGHSFMPLPLKVLVENDAPLFRGIETGCSCFGGKESVFDEDE